MTIEWIDQRQFESYEVRFGAPLGAPDQAQEDRLIAGLCRAMPTLKLREYFDCKRTLVRESEYLVCAFDGVTGDANAIFAVDKYRVGELEFTHLATMLIGHALQGTSLLMRVLGFAFTKIVQREGQFPALFSMKTYNPRSYRIMSMFCRFPGLGIELYPAVDGRSIAPALVDTAGRIAEVLSPGLPFEPASGAIRGGAGDVPADFWPTFPASSDARVNDYFQRHLNPHDRLLCVLSCQSDEAQAAIMNALGVPRAEPA